MPRVRLVLLLGRPDPNLLTTALVWSLAAHGLVLAGILAYRALSSSAGIEQEPFYVSLAGPAGAKAQSGAPHPGSPAPQPPAPAEPSPPPKPEPRPVAPPPRTPTIVPSATPHPPRDTSARKPSPEAPKPSKTAIPKDENSHAVPSDSSGGSSGDSPEEGAGGSPSAGTEGVGAEGPGVGASSFGGGDFPFAWYQTAVESKLAGAWRRPASDDPEAVFVTVEFDILRNGTVQQARIATPSGNAALDLSALRAVYDANPLPGLPKGWDSDRVHVSMKFRLAPGGA